MPTLYNSWTNSIYTQPPSYNYIWQQQTTREYAKNNASEFFLNQRTRINAQRLQQGKISVPWTNQTQDPPTLCSKQQEARGLHSVSALFLQKSTRHRKYFFKVDHFKTLRQKELGPSRIRVLFDLQRRNRAVSRQDPPVPYSKQQKARGLHPNGSTFFFKKVHTTRRSHEALHGFAQKALGRRLFLLDKTWRNKTRLPELNHEVLGGLSVRDTPQGREKI